MCTTHKKKIQVQNNNKHGTHVLLREALPSWLAAVAEGELHAVKFTSPLINDYLSHIKSHLTEQEKQEAFYIMHGTEDACFQRRLAIYSNRWSVRVTQ